MKFLSHGAEIPDDLIDLVSDGEVTFLCGAGVSHTVGLPLFKELTEMVYKFLGESMNNNFFEVFAFDKNEFDRVLGSLERRIYSNESKHAVRDAVIRIINKYNPHNLDNHTNLLKLSKNRDGFIRILTTNFDILFEKAAVLSDFPFESYAVKEIPKAGGFLDSGILHLHGRVGNDSMNLKESELILTSSDFGDAYLRDGWISRYIEDRMRLGTLVLVGYQAEDSAMRLLLETIDADRKRFNDISKIYVLDAIGQCEDFEYEHKFRTAFWDAKGIDSIIFDDYPDIYNTLSEWANYNTDANDYGHKRISKILTNKNVTEREVENTYVSRTPENSSQFELDQLNFLLNGENIPKILNEINPSLSWLPVFIGRYSGEVPMHITNWISQNFNDTNAVRDVSKNLRYFSLNSANILEANLENESELNPVLQKCWKLLISNIKDEHLFFHNITADEIKENLLKGDKSANFVTNLANISSPSLKISEKNYLWQESDLIEIEQPHDLLEIDFFCNLNLNTDFIIENWHIESELNDDVCFLSFLVYNLKVALYLATLAGLEDKIKIGITDIQVLSVAPHEQNDIRSGFYPIIQLIPAIWKIIHNINVNISYNFLTEWLTSEYRLLNRLALFLYTDSKVPANLAANALIELPIKEQIKGLVSVELHQLINTKWNKFDTTSKHKIERQIIKITKDISIENLDKNIVRNIYELLKQILHVGKELHKEAQMVLDEIQAKWPNWEPTPIDKLGFLTWYENCEIVNNDPDSLEISPNDKLYKETLDKWKKHKSFNLKEWRKLCRGSHELALEILESTKPENHIEAWNDFLSTLVKEQSFNHENRVLCSLVKIVESDFDLIANSVSYWLNRSKHFLKNREDFLLVWDRVLSSTSISKQSESELDYLTKSLNHPIGNLTESVIKLLINLSKENENISDSLLTRLDNLMKLPKNYRLYTNVIFSRDLWRLFDIIPDWIEKNIIPLFCWTEPNTAEIWSARKYTYIGSTKLFGLLKKSFLEIFARNDVSEKDKSVFAEWLVDIAIANTNHPEKFPIELFEIRSSIRKAGTNVLCSVANRLTLKLIKSKPNEIETWTSVLSPVFKSIWPLDSELQNSKTSEFLVELLCASGNAFPVAVSELIPFIRQDQSQYYSSLEILYHTDDELFKSSPEKMLELIDILIGYGPVRNNYLPNKLLDRIISVDANLSESNKYKKLKRLTR